MATSRERRTKVGKQPAEVGLAAIGSSGGWEISIDETTSGPSRWFAQIDGSSIYLRFEIASLEMVDQTIAFLTASADNTAGRSCDGTFVLGAHKSSGVHLIRDDEFSDRFFLVVQPENGPLVRLTLSGDDLGHIITALRQVAEDLR